MFTCPPTFCPACPLACVSSGDIGESWGGEETSEHHLCSQTLLLRDRGRRRDDWVGKAFGLFTSTSGRWLSNDWTSRTRWGEQPGVRNSVLIYSVAVSQSRVSTFRGWHHIWTLKCFSNTLCFSWTTKALRRGPFKVQDDNMTEKKQNKQFEDYSV